MHLQERAKLLRVHSIGPKMVDYFEAIGMHTLADFAGQDAAMIGMRIDAYLGTKRISRLGIAAIQSVIDAANRENEQYL